MIRTDKKNNKYLLVEYSDILIGLSKATKMKNKEFVALLKDVYTDVDLDDEMIDKVSYKRINKNSKLVKFLKDEVGVINFDTFISADILKDALARSYYEFNHGMKNKLSMYFRKYVDNEINGISNDIIKQEIINDRDLLEYIKKYDHFNDYIEKKVTQNIVLREKTKRKRG